MAFLLVKLPINHPIVSHLIPSKVLIGTDSLESLKAICSRHPRSRLILLPTINRHQQHDVSDKRVSVFYALCHPSSLTFSNTIDSLYLLLYAPSYSSTPTCSTGFATAIGSTEAVELSFLPPSPLRSNGFFFR